MIGNISVRLMRGKGLYLGIVFCCQGKFQYKAQVQHKAACSIYVVDISRGETVSEWRIGLEVTK